MDVFGQQAVTVAQGQRVLIALACLLAAAQGRQRIDQPEAADQEFGFRQAEIIFRRVTHHNDDAAATEKALIEKAKEWFPDATIKVTNVTGLKAVDGPVVVELDVDAPNLGSFAGSRALISMSAFGASSKNPFAATTRKHPIYFSYAWTEEDDVTLDVPDDYSVETLPADTTYDVSTAAYVTRYKALTKSVHFTRNFEVRSLYFPAESYSALRNFFSKVATADQEQITLKKMGKS